MFIARQPIFNAKLEVYGYELLFRPDIVSNRFDGASSVGATATVLEELFESGIDNIVENKLAFVNFEDAFIQSDTLELFDPKRLVVEIIESKKFDNEFINKIEGLRDKGYTIALDDFKVDYCEYPLVDVANIIKYDLIATPLETIKYDVRCAIQNGKTLFAVKVETEDEFLEAKEMGFHLFQGYFFSKPSIISRTHTRYSSLLQYNNIIRELKSEEPSYQTLAELIEVDVDLSYRLLRVVSNRSKDKSVYSIKRALTFLGLKEIERWIKVLMLQGITKSKPVELMKVSMIRSKFAEVLAMNVKLNNKRYEAAMMGLFSVLDAMLDMPMSEALDEILLPEPVVEALVKNEGILAPIYQLVLAYEKGNWDEVEAISNRLNINEYVLYSLYMSAIDWAINSLALIT